MTSIELIAFDLDGTLLDPDKEILESSIRAIESLKSQGKIVTIATGRPLYSTLPYIQQLNLDSFFSVSDSALVLNRVGDVLSRTWINPDKMREMIDVIHDHNCFTLWSTCKGLEDDCFVTEEDYADPTMRNFIEIEAQVYRLPSDILRVKNSFKEWEMKSYMVFTLGLKDDIARLAIALGNYNDHATMLSNITLHSEYHSEIYDSHALIIQRPMGARKVDGMKTILDHYKIPMENAMFFGDWYNDIDALDAVGYPVLMGNANPDLHKEEYFRTKSHNADGVVHALEYYGLL